MTQTRQQLIAKIDALAEECQTAEEAAAAGVLKSLAAAMVARSEFFLMQHVRKFTQTMIKVLGDRIASRN